jgi:hypothetical protein
MVFITIYNKVNKKKIFKKNIKISITKIESKDKYTNKNHLKHLNKILLNEKRKILFKHINKKDIINKYKILNINYVYNKIIIFCNKYKILIVLMIIILINISKYLN